MTKARIAVLAVALLLLRWLATGQVRMTVAGFPVAAPALALAGLVVAAVAAALAALVIWRIRAEQVTAAAWQFTAYAGMPTPHGGRAAADRRRT